MKESNSLKATITRVDSSLKETKLHGTPGFPFAVYLDDFSNFENGYICWHWHEEVQLTLILEGTFTVQVGNDSIRLGEGEFIFMNSGILHQIRPNTPHSGKLYSFIWRGEMISGGNKNDIFEELVKPLIASGRSYIDFGLGTEENEKYVQLLNQTVALYVEKKKYYKTNIRTNMTQIWLALLEKQYNNPELQQGDNIEEARVKMALAYMQEHFAEKIGLDDIAKAAMISRTELCRSFRKVLATSPKEYLIEYRIRRASILLKEKNLKIADIAEMTGFNSPSHFGSFFYKQTGMTPREYRE